MWSKYFFFCLAIIAVIIIQVTFLGSFDLFFLRFNFALAFLVILLFIGSFRAVLIFSLTAGTILDIYSSLPFGIFTVSFFLTAIILELLLLNFFTNRSLYSFLILGLSGMIVYRLFFSLFAGLAYLFGWSIFAFNKNYFINFGWELLDTMLLIILCFYLINKISRQFKPTFLRT